MTHRHPQPATGQPDREPEEGLDLSSALGDALAAVEALERRHQLADGSGQDSELPAAAQASHPGEDQLGARSAQLQAHNAQLQHQVVQLQSQVGQLQHQVDQFQHQVAQLQAQLGHGHEQLATLRKVVQRQDSELPQLATRKVLEQLLSPIDNLAAVIAHLQQSELLTPSGAEAVSMLQGEWARALARLEVVPFDAVGQPLDTSRHEVIARQADPAQPHGVVLRQAGRGYLWQGKVLRPAAVVINS
jgi:molecular chaperone GrpE (heat shock protein)